MNDYGHCPICGKIYSGVFEDHRCNPATLIAIDRRHNADDDLIKRDKPSFERQMSDGFLMSEIAGDDDGELDEGGAL